MRKPLPQDVDRAPGRAKVVSGNGSHAIVPVIAKEPAGQRDLSPQVRETITQTLKGRKEQLLRTAYLSAARADAQVVNYAAPAKGQAPRSFHCGKT